MNSLPELHPERKLDHHRPFVGPDGSMRVAAPGNGWRLASALEAALLSSRVQHRVVGYRSED